MGTMGNNVGTMGGLVGSWGDHGRQCGLMVQYDPPIFPMVSDGPPLSLCGVANFNLFDLYYGKSPVLLSQTQERCQFGTFFHSGPCRKGLSKFGRHYFICITVSPNDF